MVDVSGQGLVPVIVDNGEVVADSTAHPCVTSTSAIQEPPLFPPSPHVAPRSTSSSSGSTGLEGGPNAMEDELEKEAPDGARVAELSGRMRATLPLFETPRWPRPPLRRALRRRPGRLPLPQVRSGRDPADDELFPPPARGPCSSTADIRGSAHGSRVSAVAAGLAVALLACLAAGREDTDAGEPGGAPAARRAGRRCPARCCMMQPRSPAYYAGIALARLVALSDRRGRYAPRARLGQYPPDEVVWNDLAWLGADNGGGADGLSGASARPPVTVPGSFRAAGAGA